MDKELCSYCTVIVEWITRTPADSEIERRFTKPTEVACQVCEVIDQGISEAEENRKRSSAEYGIQQMCRNCPEVQGELERMREVAPKEEDPRGKPSIEFTLQRVCSNRPSDRGLLRRFAMHLDGILVALFVWADEGRRL